MRGRAIDQHGRPVAQRELWLLHTTIEEGQRPGAAVGYLQPADESHAIQKTRTDDDGRFRFDGAPVGRMWLGFAPAETADRPDPVAAIAKAIEIPERGVDFVLDAWRALYVRGVVRTPDGSLASARHVAGFGRDVPGLVSTTSDASGAFVLGPLGPGEIQVWALGAPDFVDTPQVIARAGDSGVALELAAGTRIAGRVVDEYGAALAQAEVARFWLFDHSPSGSARGALVTCADGRFEGIDAGGTESSCLLAYSADRTLAGRIDVTADDGAAPHEIVMKPCVRVHGRIASRELGRDVARTNVYWKALDCGHSVAQCASTRAEFDVRLPVGRYEWHAYGTDVRGQSGELELALGTPDVDLGTIDLAAKFLTLNRGKELPEWTVSDARGVALEHAQLADFRGKWLLVEFWGYW